MTNFWRDEIRWFPRSRFIELRRTAQSLLTDASSSPIHLSHMGRFHGLDALRGVAAVCVLLGHAENIADSPRIFASNYLAVDFFFMLSGFVMERTYGDRLPKMPSIAFVTMRLRRLWPPLAFGALIGAAVNWHAMDPGLHLIVVATNLALIPLLAGPAAFPFNTPTWSVFFEILGNAIHALALRFLSTAGLLAVSAVCFVALVLRGRGLDVGWEPDGFWYGIPRILMDYCIGMAICRANLKARGSLWFAILVLPLGIVIGSVYLPHVPAFEFAFALLLCPLLVLCGLGDKEIPGWLKFLGRISFPLYAVHLPVLRAVIENGGHEAAGIAAAFAVAFIASALFDPKGLNLPSFVRSKAGAR